MKRMLSIAMAVALLITQNVPAGEAQWEPMMTVYADCNEMLRDLITHSEEVVALVREGFQQTKEALAIEGGRVTKDNKQEALQKYQQSIQQMAEERSGFESKENSLMPCDILKDRLLKQYALCEEMLTQASQFKDSRSVRVAEHVKALVQTNHVDAFVLSVDGMTSVNAAESITFDVLVDIVSKQYVQGLNLIYQSAITFKKPLMNAPYAQGMLQVVLSAMLSATVQRWLENDFSREQWVELLERRYQAFADIVPHVCGVIDGFRSVS